MRGRRKDATNRRTVASMRVWIEHEIDHTWRLVPAGGQAASKPARIEFVPMTVMGLPLSPGAGMKPGGLTCGIELGWVFYTHFEFLCSTNSTVQIKLLKTILKGP